MLVLLRWRRGQAIWQSPMRFVTAGLAAVGAVLLGITGTLGGHLIGVYTEVSQILRKFGWEVYTTFYVPDTALFVLGFAAVALLVIGLRAHTSRA